MRSTPVKTVLVLGAVLVALVGLHVLRTYNSGDATVLRSAANQTKGTAGGTPDRLAASAVPTGPEDSVFVHTATSKTVSADSTYLNNRLINDDPNATVLVTQNWNPDGRSGTYNPHPVGVWYDRNRKRWAIFNEDRAAMPEGASFNVVVTASGGSGG